MTSTGDGVKSETGRRHGKARSGRWSRLTEAGWPSCGREVAGAGGGAWTRRRCTMAWAVEDRRMTASRMPPQQQAGVDGSPEGGGLEVLGHHAPDANG